MRRGRLFLEVMVIQGALGYLQYFLHDASLVVEFHLAGVTITLDRGDRLLPVVAPPSAPGRSAPAAGTPRSGVLVADPERTMTLCVRHRPPPRAEVERPETREAALPELPWLVIVWNDPINLMSYVTYVFQKLFGYSRPKAHKLMLDVHYKGPRRRLERAQGEGASSTSPVSTSTGSGRRWSTASEL